RVADLVIRYDERDRVCLRVVVTARVEIADRRRRAGTVVCIVDVSAVLERDCSEQVSSHVDKVSIVVSAGKVHTPLRVWSERIREIAHLQTENELPRTICRIRLRDLQRANVVPAYLVQRISRRVSHDGDTQTVARAFVSYGCYMR